MGCASSTPMIKTADSDIFKMATHIVEDATTTADEAVKDASKSVSQTVDTAKATIAMGVSDLGNTIQDKSNDAKTTLMEILHIKTTNAGEVSESVKVETIQTSETSEKATPVHDIDSLNTLTLEPEIEQAMKNGKESESSTPKAKEELQERTLDSKQTKSMSREVSEAINSFAGEPDTAKRPGTTEWERYADLLWKTKKVNADRKAFSNTLNNNWPQTPESSGFSDGYNDGTYTSKRKSRTRLHKKRMPLNWKLARNLPLSLRKAFLTTPTNENMNYFKLSKPIGPEMFENPTMRFEPHSYNFLRNQQSKNTLLSYGIRSRVPASSSLSDSDSQDYMAINTNSRVAANIPFIPRSRTFIKERTNDENILLMKHPTKQNNMTSVGRMNFPSSRFIKPTTKSSLINSSVVPLSPLDQKMPEKPSFIPSSKTLKRDISFLKLPFSTNSRNTPCDQPKDVSTIRRTCSVSSLSSSSDGVIVRPLCTSSPTFLSLPLKSKKNLPTISLSNNSKNSFNGKNNSSGLDPHMYPTLKPVCKSTLKTLSFDDFSCCKDNTLVAVDGCTLSPNRRKNFEHRPNISFNQCAVCFKTYVVKD